MGGGGAAGEEETPEVTRGTGLRKRIGAPKGRGAIHQQPPKATRPQGAQLSVRARVRRRRPVSVWLGCLPHRYLRDVGISIFQAPWDKILHSTEIIAASHQVFAQRIEQDVEGALRAFQTKREMLNMQTISANLHTMAKELEEAQEKSDKLTKKGGKANTQKVELAAAKLESATGQWESQAPFIFETLQALDEQRINHLRDVLTQYLTHEVDQASRSQASAEQALNTMLEINTGKEIEDFATRTVFGKPRLEKRTSHAVSRQPSVVASSSLAPPPSSVLGHEDDVSDTSGPREGQPGQWAQILLRAVPRPHSQCYLTDRPSRISTAESNRHHARPASTEPSSGLWTNIGETKEPRHVHAKHCKQPWSIIAESLIS